MLLINLKMVLLASLLISASPASVHAESDDPFLWLEEVEGKAALNWVEAHNAATSSRLQGEQLETLYQEALSALNNAQRIPDIFEQSGQLYNFWQDAEHPRGVLRRTNSDSFRSHAPPWEIVLDIDLLAKNEDKKWSYGGIECLPGSDRFCMLSLSPGGGDATVWREFDLGKGSFVSDGFFLPAGKSAVAWVDRQRLFVGTDFGADSLTESGYPRIVKLWSRGTSLCEALPIHTGAEEAVSVSIRRLHSRGGDIDLVVEAETFWSSRFWQWQGDTLNPLKLPVSARIEGNYRGHLIVMIHDEWQWDDQLFSAGSLLAVQPETLRGGTGSPQRLIAPDETTVIEEVNVSDQVVAVTLLANVRAKIALLSEDNNGKWVTRFPSFPDLGMLNVTEMDHESGAFYARYEGFLKPPTLYHAAGPDWQPEILKAQPPSFDPTSLGVTQHFATSSDGTRVPYFMVASKKLQYDGRNPTHIFSYGGFRVSLTPSYSGSYEPLNGTYGKLWLQRGGVFVLANIRGGGEFGPDWHRAALLKNRHKAFEDFEAIVSDLTSRGVTSAPHIGIEGRSNGGLLVGTLITRHPERYGAAVIGVPLLDMSRYHKLLAGASWVDEYGDPDDPEMWRYIKSYSPYHNLKAGIDYPATLFFTSTRDDRVHPGHARKMAARMESLGQQIEYYENTEGGHGGSSTSEQLARRLALVYAHLWRHLR